MKEKTTPGMLGGTSTPVTSEIPDDTKDSPITGEYKCPTCGTTMPFTSWDWLDELSMLLARHAGRLGISPELAGFTPLEMWDHYIWLRGLYAMESELLDAALEYPRICV